MTTYFDQKAGALRDPMTAADLDAFEESLLGDMVLVCESFRGEPGLEFPRKQRASVYAAMRRWLTAAWSPSEPYKGPDYEDDDARVQGLRELVEALHTCFHAAAHAGWEGGDSPTWVHGELRCRFRDAVEKRGSDDE